MKFNSQGETARKIGRRSSAITAAGLIAGALVGNASVARADSAYAFGLNVTGEMGNGTSGNGSPTFNSSAVAVSLDSSVTSVAGGTYHSLYVDNGALLAAGYGSYGQLGTGGTNLSNPLPLAVGNFSSGATAASGGYLYSMAIANGGLYFFGANSSGEQGNGAQNTTALTPTLVNSMSRNVTQVTTGERDVLAVQNGALYAWGYDNAGQVGDSVVLPFPNPYSPTQYVTTPFAVPGMSSGITSIASGSQHSLAVMNGAAYAWGWNIYGQLANGGNTGYSLASTYTSPTPVVGLPVGLPVSTVSAGNNSSMALVLGVAYAWGINEYGELGNGSASGMTVANQTPTAVTGITGFLTNVQEGTWSSYALGADGSLWTWGRNNYGQLGIGSTTDQYIAQHVMPPAGKVYTSISVGSFGDHAVLTVGAAPYSWVPDASGDWNDSTNWTSGVPNSVDAPVTFVTGSITAPRTINVTTPITVGNLSFTSAVSYLIGGSGSITIQANLSTSVRGAAINDYVGNHTIAPAVLEFSTNSNLNVSYGSTLTLGAPSGNVLIDSNTSVTETGYGSVVFNSMVSLASAAGLNLTAPTSINGLTLGSNAVTTDAAHGFFSNNLLQLGSLSLSSTAKLNLTNNEAIVHGGDLGAITSALSTGYAGGAWNGFGIISSSAASDTTYLTALGSLLATTSMTAGGQSLQAGDVLIKYTYYGDATLDGVVDGSDYSRIDNGFMLNLTGWNNGDFNYDGTVDGSDYTLIDNAFNEQGAALSAQIASRSARATAEIAGGSGTSAVPEPGSACLFGFAATGLLVRRRRNVKR